MLDYFSAAILGVVQGLTEFLPVSSSGHLIIVSHLLGLHGEAIKAFEVFIQLGSIFAVLWLYRARFWRLLQPAATKGFSGLRGIALLIITSAPAAILGKLCYPLIKSYLFGPKTVALALATGAVAMLIVERLPISRKIYTLDEISPKFALWVGLGQCFALWPGFSRSASTIMGGLLAGGTRSLAAEYSFIAAVPIMFAATGFDLLKSYPVIERAHLPAFGLGFLVSFLSALLAIKIFVQLISRINFTPFAIYRLCIAPVIYFILI